MSKLSRLGLTENLVDSISKLINNVSLQQIQEKKKTKEEEKEEETYEDKRRKAIAKILHRNFEEQRQIEESKTLKDEILKNKKELQKKNNTENKEFVNKEIENHKNKIDNAVKNLYNEAPKILSDNGYKKAMSNEHEDMYIKPNKETGTLHIHTIHKNDKLYGTFSRHSSNHNMASSDDTVYKDKIINNKYNSNMSQKDHNEHAINIFKTQLNKAESAHDGTGKYNLNNKEK